LTEKLINLYDYSLFFSPVVLEGILSVTPTGVNTEEIPYFSPRKNIVLFLLNYRHQHTRKNGVYHRGGGILPKPI